MNASDKLPRSGYIKTIYEYLLGLIKKLDANTQSLRSRMNALTALANSGGVPAGTIEAEVTDARVDSSGQVYANLGEAVRGQIEDVYGATVELVEVLSDDIRTDANGVKHSSAGAAIRDVCSTMKGEIDNLDEKSGKLLIPAGNKTYLAQLQVVNNKPVLAYVEEE